MCFGLLFEKIKRQNIFNLHESLISHLICEPTHIHTMSFLESRTPDLQKKRKKTVLRRSEACELLTADSLADFLVLCNLLDVEQVVQPGLVVVFGQRLVEHRLGEELVGRQRDLVAGQEAALQLGHGLVGRELHDGLAGRVPALGRQQELLPGGHQVFQVWGGHNTGW